MSNRPAIPEAIKRAVRQACGYGCVICGNPVIYDYEHLTPYSEIQSHTEENIYILCRNHHGEKHANLLPLSVIQGARSNPHNLSSGRTEPYPLRYSGSQCVFLIGGNRFERELSSQNELFSPIVTSNEALLSFRFENNHILVSACIYNEAGLLCLEICDNQLIMAVENWDINFTANRVVIRKALGNIIIEIEFTPPSWINIKRGSFFTSTGYPLFIEENRMLLGEDGIGATFLGCVDKTDRPYCVVVDSNSSFANNGLIVIDNSWPEE